VGSNPTLSGSLFVIFHLKIGDTDKVAKSFQNKAVAVRSSDHDRSCVGMRLDEFAASIDLIMDMPDLSIRLGDVFPIDNHLARADCGVKFKLGCRR
jgi:hypothetical protein